MIERGQLMEGSDQEKAVAQYVQRGGVIGDVQELLGESWTGKETP